MGELDDERGANCVPGMSTGDGEREIYKKSLQQLVIVAKAGRLNTRLGLE